MPFQPGRSGNPGGRPKTKPFADAMRMELALLEKGEDTPAPTGSLRWNVRRLLESGEVTAIKEIADRLDGKVPQAVVGDDEHDPIKMLHRIERVIVDPANPDSAGIPAASPASSV